MEEIIKALGGLKTEVMSDVNRIVEATKAESLGTVKDLEAQLQSKVNDMTEKLKGYNEDMKQALEESETEMKKSMQAVANKTAKDLTIDAVVTEALMSQYDLIKGLKGEASLDIIKTPAPGVMTTAGSITGAGGAPTVAEIFAIQNNQYIEPIARRQVHIRNILGMGTSDQATFNYLVETPKVGGVGVQNPEGTAKSKYESQFDLKLTQASTIAATQRVGKQTLENVRGLATLVQALMLNDLLIFEDTQLLNGTNTNGQVQGFVPGARAVSTLALDVVAPNIYDVIASSAATLAADDIIADFALLNPLNYWEMVTTKDKDERYQNNVIFNAQTNQLFVFGVPTFPTTAIAAGSFVVGASRYAMPMQYRGISLVLDETGVTNREANTVLIRVEEQILQAVTKPTAFIAGTIAAAKAAITPGS